MTTRLERLLRPKSICVVGGGGFGTNVVRQTLKMKFPGELWVVHPTKDTVEGVRTYKTIADLPGAPDAVFIGVNRNLTIGVIRELRDKGAGGAVCFAAGFRETGDYDADGERLQQELVEAAGDMAVIGPNCYGLINYADGALLWPDQHGGRRLTPGETGAAIITQSSNIACNLTMQQRGLPVAYLMTAGNQAQTGLSEMALGLIEDDRVSCLGLHIEGFDSAAGFERLAARARQLRKPIVAMKVGRSEAARAATISHTASLAGSDAASDAFLKRLGIPRVDTIPSFLETLKLFHVVGPLEGGALSSMSCSGGEASVMADSAEGRTVSFPKVTPAHKARVSEALGPLVAVANPLDYNTYVWNNEPAMTAAFGAMVSGSYDLNMLVLDFPRTDRCSDADWWPTVRAFDAALRVNGAKGAIVASMGENLSEGHAEKLIGLGIAPLLGIAEAFDATEAAVMVGQAWGGAFPSPLAVEVAAKRPEGVASTGTPSAETPPLRLPSAATSPPARARGTEPAKDTAAEIGASSPPTGGRGGPAQPGRSGGIAPSPDEAEAKALLASHGLPVPAGRRAATADEAVAAAEALGYPVAVKALGVAHKSEAGAVKLNLRDAAAVKAAADAMAGLGTGLYVERMVTGAVAELIVGITRDPLFGPVMTVGTGGVLVELLKDSRTLLLPSSKADIEAALRSLQMFPLLDGYRGRPRADLAAAVDAIATIADFALANDGLEELDINPLMVCEQGAWVADALMVLSSPRAGEVAAKRPEGGTSEGTAPAPRRSPVTPPDPAPPGHPPRKGEG